MTPKGKAGQDDQPAPIVTRKIAAEAATWIARLHGPSRSPKMESEFRKWLARSAAHRLAFERCTDVWEEVPGLSVADAYGGAADRAMRAALARERWWDRWRWPLWALVALSLAVAAYAVHRWMHVDVYTTKVGEQQQVMLTDGTRMSLNTSTRVRVEVDAELRSVHLDSGEVMLEVAKDPRRPFIVHAGDSEVIAVGTVFSVRLASSGDSDASLAVALIEGEVLVRPASPDLPSAMAPLRPVTMRPGERIRLSRPAGEPGAPAVAQVDRPAMDPLVAWKRGEAVFDDISLSEAVSEMNRYTRTPIVLLGSASTLRVSGSYPTGNSLGFANAVAVLHGLEVREHDGRVELVPPQ